MSHNKFTSFFIILALLNSMQAFSEQTSLESKRPDNIGDIKWNSQKAAIDEIKLLPVNAMDVSNKKLGGVVYVGPAGSSCASSIQAAVNNTNYDQIRLLQGVYSENIVITRSVEIKGGYGSCSAFLATGDSTIDGEGGSTAAPTIRTQLSDGDTVDLINLKIIDGTNGVRAEGIGSTVNIINSTISLNNTNHDGLGNIFRGGGLAIFGGTAVLDDTNISMNTAELGGGIYCTNAQVILTGSSSITSNTATSNISGAGGGVYVSTGCDFQYLATDNGNSISFNKTLSSDGGGISAFSSDQTNPASITLSPLIIGGPASDLGTPILMVSNKAGTEQDPKAGSAIYADGFVDIIMQRVEIKNHTIGDDLIRLADNSKLSIHCGSFNQLCNFISNNSAEHLINFRAIPSDLFSDLDNAISFTQFDNNTADTLINAFTALTDGFDIKLKLSKSVFSNNIVGSGELFLTNTGPVDISHITSLKDLTNISRVARVYAGGTLNLSHSLLSSNSSTGAIVSFTGAEPTPVINIDCTISDFSNFTQSGITTVTRSMKVQNIEFVDAENGDYHLQSYSPAVDYCPQASDDNGKDIDGNDTGLDNPYMINLNNGVFDVGADEVDVFIDIIFKDGFE